MKKLLTILLTLIGCAAVLLHGDKAPSEITLKDIENSEYAYIIGRCNLINKWGNTIQPTNRPYNKNNVVQLDYRMPRRYTIYKVFPGKYTLIYFSGSLEKHRMINENIKDNDSFYASFAVEKGKLYYLGDISIILKPYRGILLDDNFTEAENYIKNNYENLKDTIIERADVQPGIYFR